MVASVLLLLAFPDAFHGNDDLVATASLPGILLDLLPILPAFVIHELGHIAGTLVSGGRFHALGLGPLLVKRSSAGVRIERNRVTPLFVVGTVSAEHPLWSYAVQVVGGPVANLVTYPIAAAAWLVLSPVAPAAAYMAYKLAIYSVMLFAINLLPMTAAGFASDGARLLELWRAGPSARGLVGMLRIQALDLGGASPREWPRADVAAASGLLETGARSGWVARLCVTVPSLLSTRAFAEAEVEIDRLLANAQALPSSYVRVVHTMAALLAARRGDVARARSLLATAPVGLRPIVAEACVEAAMRRAEGAVESAVALARDVLATADVAATGQEVMWRELLADELHAEASSRG